MKSLFLKPLSPCTNKWRVLFLLVMMTWLFPVNQVICQQPKVAGQTVTSPVGTAVAGSARNKEQLRIVKSYARLSFKKYLSRKVIEKTREMAIEIKGWTFDEEKERYTIDYEVNFEILKDDFYGDQWINLKRTFLLSCDTDGQNASLKNIEEKQIFIFENISN